MIHYIVVCKFSLFLQKYTFSLNNEDFEKQILSASSSRSCRVIEYELFIAAELLNIYSKLN